ncbi:hypothetical protein [Bartonella saheliensis]|uniref:hypothetical protein n=1 Tax=Bartonella saheliensis TaxID=1457016 RepID=UPI0011A89029|nr:hypothetical protein [Bartonella saheliensis]
MRDGKQTSIELESRTDDIFGVVIGGNPATFYQKPPGRNALKEIEKVLFGYPSPHLCYGNASQACQNDYGVHNSIQINASKSWRKK